MEETWGRRMLRLITPELVYLGVCFLVEMVIGMVMSVNLVNDYMVSDSLVDTDALSEALTELLYENDVLIQTAGAAVSLIFLSRMYFKDFSRRRFVFNRDSVGRVYWLLPVLAGALGAFGCNLIMNIGDMTQISEGFEEAEAALFSGSFIVQLIGIGFIIPFAEEFVYRGLIYMRMRQYLDVTWAIAVSALIFGIMHGNIIQGVYGFLIGMLCAYVFEKYGSLSAPVVVHMSANLLSLGLSLINLPLDSVYVLAVLGAAGIAGCLLTVYVIDRRVDAEKVYFSN